jgi:methionyl-tRNA formyltransferase
MMKIGFFGTPDIAARCLEYLAGRFDIVFAVSCEDKPRGRNLRVCETPVREAASRLGIPVLQPASIKDPSFAESLHPYEADIFVVVAYGKIIPRAVFAHPRLGSINLHPSLLPLYRGAAPVEWAIRSGETVSGVTVQCINERLDAGDIILQEKMDLGHEETAGEFFDRAVSRGAKMLEEAVLGLDAGTIQPQVQNEALATYCGKITKDGSRIGWDESSESIHNQIRAFNPTHIAWTTLRGKNIRVLRSSVPHGEGLPSLCRGELAVFAKKRLFTGTGNGLIEILELHPETKKVMDAVSFINGYRLMPGERWDSENN